MVFKNCLRVFKGCLKVFKGCLKVFKGCLKVFRGCLRACIEDLVTNGSELERPRHAAIRAKERRFRIVAGFFSVVTVRANGVLQQSRAVNNLPRSP